MTEWPLYGLLCRILLRKEVLGQHEFDGGFGAVSEDFGKKVLLFNCFYGNRTRRITIRQELWKPFGQLARRLLLRRLWASGAGCECRLQTLAEKVVVLNRLIIQNLLDLQQPGIDAAKIRG